MIKKDYQNRSHCLCRRKVKIMKLIAIDMDGTLLNEKHQISEENSQAIRQAEEQGVEVVIATGRAYFDARSICEKAGLNPYIISYTGATIHSKEGQSIYSMPMDKQDVKQIVRWLDEKNFYYEVSTDTGIYTPAVGKEILQVELDELRGTPSETKIVELERMMTAMYGQFGMKFFNKQEEFMNRDEGFYKILGCSFNAEKHQNGMNQFSKMKQLGMVSSADSNFEILNQQASKGNALELLAAELKIPFDEVMAIGDSPNDISMLERVEHSVAMGNAKEEIKGICKFVTYTNRNNGVAHAIYQYALGAQ